VLFELDLISLCVLHYSAALNDCMLGSRGRWERFLAQCLPTWPLGGTALHALFHGPAFKAILPYS